MKTYIIITSEGPQAGKGTAGSYLAGKLGVEHCASSDSITKRVAEKEGVTPQFIKTARKSDPDNYRPELIEEGKKMIVEGTYPSIECFKDGYAIVDGQRFLDEVKAIQQWVYDQGADLYHIHIVGRSNGKDSTESEKLFDAANAIVYNDSTIEALHMKLDTILVWNEKGGSSMRLELKTGHE